jgi:putative intracellular protease/amidase
MVVSGYGKGQGEEAPGYEFDEFAKAYLVFNAHNVNVDVASPLGGPVEADKYDPNKIFNAKVLADTAIMAKLNDTLAIGDLDAQNYDAVFIVGGKGAMFDLPKDAGLQQLIAKVYEQDGAVAAVCHGPAALVDVKLSNGTYLVDGKVVNGFTNEEESLFGKKWMPQFEFMLEDKLKEAGGKFQSSDIMLSHVAVDERLVTGQNPASTVGVAMALIDMLNIPRVPFETFKDDRTLARIAKVLEGDNAALLALHDSDGEYHIELAGMYGFYYLKQATTDAQKQHALSLMLVAQEAINNPNLDIQIATTQQQLGDIMASQQTAEKILSQHPDFAPAQQLLESLTQ